MITKFIYASLLLFAIVSCSSEQDDSKIKEKKQETIKSRDIQSSNDSNEESEAEEIEKVDLETLFALAGNDESWQRHTISNSDSFFILNIANKDVSFPCNRFLESDPLTYEYLGDHEDLKLFFVELNEWEHHEVHLIDQITGNKHVLWSPPIFSPNSQFLISKSRDYGMEGIPNGYQVWERDDQRNWAKIIEVDQQEWIPEGFKWTSDTAFIMSRTDLQAETRKGDFESYARINILD